MPADVRRPLQRDVMRHGFHADGRPQRRVILKDGHDAAIVLLLMDLEHQTEKQLRLGILPGRAEMSIGRQLLHGRGVSRQQHLPWRFAGG